MTENQKELKKVSFTKYLHNDGTTVQSVSFALHGEVLMFDNAPIDNGFIRVASVSCTDDELYFVPFDYLVYMDKV